MIKLLLIGLGGFLGSVLRALMSTAIQAASAGKFPFGTLAVNVLGCLVIGGLAELVETRDLFSAETRAFLFVGVLGGFTTYSSFGNETISLWRGGANGLAVLNITAHLIIGLGAVWLGRVLASRF